MVGAVEEMDGGLLVLVKFVWVQPRGRRLWKRKYPRERDPQGRETHRQQEAWFCSVIDSQYFNLWAFVKKCLLHIFYVTDG